MKHFIQSVRFNVFYFSLFSDFDEIFNEEEKDTLSHIFLDMKSATNLLGFKICHYLNESINHEAIDYLHDISLKNVLCVDFLVCGDARPQVMELGPKILSIGGYMSVGKTYKGSLYFRFCCCCVGCYLIFCYFLFSFN